MRVIDLATQICRQMGIHVFDQKLEGNYPIEIYSIVAPIETIYMYHEKKQILQIRDKEAILSLRLRNYY